MLNVVVVVIWQSHWVANMWANMWLKVITGVHTVLVEEVLYLYR